MSQSGSWKFTPEAMALVSQLINSRRWMTRGRAQGPECQRPVMELEWLRSGWGREGGGLGAAGDGAGWAPWCWLPLRKGMGENGGFAAGIPGAPTVPAPLSKDNKRALAFPMLATLWARGM